MRFTINTIAKTAIVFLSLFFSVGLTPSFSQKPSLSFDVKVKDVSAQLFSVTFHCEGLKKDSILFKMSNWTPGYYQLMNYADEVSGFNVKGKSTDTLRWNKSSNNSWIVYSNKSGSLTITYDVKATRPFVAANYLDSERAYISPAGFFIYPEGMLSSPVTVTMEKYPGWNKIATGLDAVAGKENTFRAANYDILFDSPILAGKLETFPSFTVNNIPHHFYAYKASDFDRNQFMSDIQKIVKSASDIIGEIPYRHYSFLAIGPGGGGIEHLNSTSISFDGKGLETKEGRIGTYNFLAHEYFHHYNVKRIRPIELGPFDYDNGSKTKMLWLSEGITVYYEYLILKRAGLTNEAEMLEEFQSSIKGYESKPGRQFQTPAEASYNTWSEGPFGRTGDEVNKTISPYDKGPALGLLLDFKIRHETKNKKSLDDLMRLLYRKYYKEKQRGFTEEEFKNEVEKIAGTSLNDFFDYIYTLKQVDYPTYLGYAGLSIDTVAHELPGGWLGISVRDKNDSLIVSNTEWQSPAWNTGVRNRNIITAVNGNKVNAKSFNEMIGAAKNGDKIKLQVLTSTGLRELEITLNQKKEKSFLIKRISNPDALQQSILKSWLGE